VTDTNVFLERERTYCSVAHPYRIIKKSIESNSCVPGAGGVQSECGNPFCRVAATTGITRESTTPDSCVVIGGISKQSAITDCSVVGAFGVAEEGERPVRSIVAPSRIIYKCSCTDGCIVVPDVGKQRASTEACIELAV